MVFGIGLDMIELFENNHQVSSNYFTGAASKGVTTIHLLLINIWM